jgi:hypothetical protein
MRPSILDFVKRCPHVQYDAIALPCYDTSEREALAIAQAVNVKFQRPVRPTGSDEVTMQGMHGSLRRDGNSGGGGGLAQYLPPVDSAPGLQRCRSPKAIFAERRQFEQFAG